MKAALMFLLLAGSVFAYMPAFSIVDMPYNATEFNLSEDFPAMVSPSSKFYPLKRAWESVNLWLPFGDKAVYRIELLDERVKEMGAEVAMNHTQAIDQLSNEYEVQAEELDAELNATEDSAIVGDSAVFYAKHALILHYLYFNVPNEAKPGIERAFDNADKHFNKAKKTYAELVVKDEQNKKVEAEKANETVENASEQAEREELRKTLETGTPIPSEMMTGQEAANEAQIARGAHPVTYSKEGLAIADKMMADIWANSSLTEAEKIKEAQNTIGIVTGYNPGVYFPSGSEFIPRFQPGTEDYYRQCYRSDDRGKTEWVDKCTGKTLCGPSIGTVCRLTDPLPIVYGLTVNMFGHLTENQS